MPLTPSDISLLSQNETTDDAYNPFEMSTIREVTPLTANNIIEKNQAGVFKHVVQGIKDFGLATVQQLQRIDMRLQTIGMSQEDSDRFEAFRLRQLKVNSDIAQMEKERNVGGDMELLGGLTSVEGLTAGVLSAAKLAGEVALTGGTVATGLLIAETAESELANYEQLYTEKNGTLQGFDRNKARLTAVASGAVQSALEMSFGPEKWFKGVLNGKGLKETAGNIGKRVLKNAVTEGPGESLQSAVSIAGEKFLGLNDKTFSENMKRIISDGVTGALIGGVWGETLYRTSKKRLTKALQEQGLSKSEAEQTATAILQEASSKVVNEMATRDKLINQYGDVYDSLKEKVRQVRQNADPTKTVEDGLVEADTVNIAGKYMFLSNSYGLPVEDVMKLTDIEVSGNTLLLNPKTLGATKEEILARREELRDEINHLRLSVRNGQTSLRDELRTVQNRKAIFDEYIETTGIKAELDKVRQEYAEAEERRKQAEKERLRKEKEVHEAQRAYEAEEDARKRSEYEAVWQNALKERDEAEQREADIAKTVDELKKQEQKTYDDANKRFTDELATSPDLYGLTQKSKTAKQVADLFNTRQRQREERLKRAQGELEAVEKVAKRAEERQTEEKQKQEEKALNAVYDKFGKNLPDEFKGRVEKGFKLTERLKTKQGFFEYLRNPVKDDYAFEDLAIAQVLLFKENDAQLQDFYSVIANADVSRPADDVWAEALYTAPFNQTQEAVIVTKAMFAQKPLKEQVKTEAIFEDKNYVVDYKIVEKDGKYKYVITARDGTVRETKEYDTKLGANLEATLIQGEIKKMPFEIRYSRTGDKTLAKKAEANDLKRDFGFKDVKAGKASQEKIKTAYDAFYDLAKALRVPMRAIGLNGELSLNLDKSQKNAQAFFDWEKKSLNFKKFYAAYAHEWSHALDNLLARGEDDFTSAGFGSARAEVKEAYSILMGEIFRSDFYRRAKQSKKRKYYADPTELVARAFENYIADKMPNEQLAINKTQDVYLKEDEKPEIYSAFDNLFYTLRSKTTETGVQLYQGDFDFDSGHRGRGYVGYSMSVNMAEAQENNELPASKAAKALKVSTQAIRKYLEPSAWHHASAMFNEVNVYDINPFLNLIAGKDLSETYNESEIQEFKDTLQKMRDFKEEKKEAENFKGNAEWVEWGGVGRRKKPVEHKYENIKITKKGAFYTFHLPDGTDVRKGVGSNGTYVVSNEELKAQKRLAKLKEKIKKIQDKDEKALRKEFDATFKDAFKEIKNATFDTFKKYRNEENFSGDNVYIYGQKPQGANKEKGLRRLHYDFNEQTYTLQEFNGDDWKDLETRKDFVPDGKEYPPNFFSWRNEKGFSPAYIGTVDEAEEWLAERAKTEERKGFENENDQLAQGGRKFNALFDPELSAIVLTSNANEYSLAHEMEHFWLKTVFEMYKDGKGNDAFREQFKNLMEILGITEDQKELTREQQEQFAVTMEAFVSGKARVQQGVSIIETIFKAWCPEKYKSARSIAYVDKKGKVVTPLIDKKTADFFNEWLGYLETPKPLQTVFVNPDDDEAKKEVVKERESVLAEAEKERNEAETEKTAVFENGVPAEQRAGIAVEQEALRQKTQQRRQTETETATETPENEPSGLVDRLKRKFHPTGASGNKGRVKADTDAVLTKMIEKDFKGMLSVALGFKEADSNIDIGRLILLMKDRVTDGETKKALDLRLADWKSQAGRSLALTNEVSMKTYLDALGFLNKEALKRFFLKHKGVRFVSDLSFEQMDKFNREIDSFAEKYHSEFFDATNEEDKINVLRKMLIEARAFYGVEDQKSFDSDKGLLTQLDLSGIKDKNAFMIFANSWIKQNIGAEVDSEVADKVRDLAEKAKDAVDALNSRDVDTAIAGVKTIKEFTDYIENQKTPSNVWEKLVDKWLPSIIPNVMLSNPGTHVKNFVSNSFSGLAYNKALDIHYGESAVSSGIVASEQKRLEEIWKATGVTLSQKISAKDEDLVHGERYRQSLNWNDGWSAKLVPYNLLGYSDMKFRNEIYLKALEGLATKYAKENGVDADEVFLKLCELPLNKPSQADLNDLLYDNSLNEARVYKMREEAVTIGQLSVFTENGEFAKTLNKLRNVLNLGRGFGVGSMMAYFVKTPANIVTQGLSATVSVPRAVFETTVQKKTLSVQRKAEMLEFAQGLFVLGVLSLAGGHYEPPYDREEKGKYDKTKAYDSIVFGDFAVSLESFGPASTPLRIMLTAIKDLVADDRQDGAVNASLRKMAREVPFVDALEDFSVQGIVNAFADVPTNAFPRGLALTLRQYSDTDLRSGDKSVWGRAYDREMKRLGLDGEENSTNQWLRFWSGLFQLENVE